MDFPVLLSHTERNAVRQVPCVGHIAQRAQHAALHPDSCTAKLLLNCEDRVLCSVKKKTVLLHILDQIIAFVL